MYFAGPENLSLELSYSHEPIDNRAWIDPEVVALAGISEDELARYTHPPTTKIKEELWLNPVLMLRDRT